MSSGRSLTVLSLWVRLFASIPSLSMVAGVARRHVGALGRRRIGRPETSGRHHGRTLSSVLALRSLRLLLCLFLDASMYPSVLVSVSMFTRMYLCIRLLQLRLCLSFSLSLSVYLSSLSLSICLFVCLSVGLSFYLHLSLLSLSLSLSLSVCLSISLSLYFSVSLCVFLSL